MSTWADTARAVIFRVIAEVGREDPEALRTALRAAYPFGERRYFPYKVWCREVRVALTGAPTRAKRAAITPEGQPSLFEEPAP